MSTTPPPMRTPYFAVESVARGPGWTTLAALIDDPRPKVAATRDQLGGPHVHWRVAASIDLLGTAARIVSPALATAADAGCLPVLTAGQVWWRPSVPAPMRLAWAPDGFVPADVPGLHGCLVDALLAPLVASYAAAFTVSRRVLWGDVASALAAAVQLLKDDTVEQLVVGALSTGRLAGSAVRLPPAFRRASCCLYYRVPGAAGLCGDCVLTSPPRLRRRPP